MTFSQKVKDEIIKQKWTDEESLSLIGGLLLSCGNLAIRKNSISFCLSSEFNQIIDFAKSLILKEMPDVTFEEEVVKKNFKNKERTELSINAPYGEELLMRLGVLFLDKNGNRQICDIGDDSLRASENQTKAFLAGIFLGSGSISVPSSVDIDGLSASNKSSGYHMEWVTGNNNIAKTIMECLSALEILPKMVERYDSFVIYIKESDQIVQMLGLFGAYTSLLDLENQKASRQMINLINRQANCLQANYDKSVAAAVAQLEAIKIIEETVGLGELSTPLQEIAMLRKNNPKSSLGELVNLLNNRVSKGAVAQRLKKIIEISKTL